MNDLNLKIKIGSDSKQAEESVSRVNSALKGLENSSQKLNGMLSKLGVGISAAGMAAFIKSSVDVSKSMDSIERSLNVTSGSSKNAAADMDFLSKTSNKLGIDLISSAKAFADLQASAQGTVLQGQATRDMFTAVSKAMSALGKSSDDTQGALLAIGQMMSKGGVNAEELRGQLGERLPGAFNIMAKAMDVSTAELSKLLEQGKVGIDVLPKFAAELDKAYGNAKLDGISSSLNRIGNAWDQLLAASGKAINLEVFLKTVADAVTPDATNPYTDLQARQNTLNSLISRRELFGVDASEYRKELQGIGKELDTLDRKWQAQQRLSMRGGGMQSIYDEYDEVIAQGQKFADTQALLNKGQSDAQERLWKQNRDNIDKLTAQSEQAAKQAQSVAEQLDRLYESSALGLQKQIALRGENSAAAEMEFEVEFGAYKTLNDAQKVKLLNLAAEKDYVTTLIGSYKEYDDVIDQGNQLAGRQRASMSADFERLTQIFSGENQGMYSQFDDAFQARGMGIIDDNQLARSLENISQGFDAITGKAADSADQMSEFFVSAARNMQTAFADFLFDPFEQGADGMLESFTNVVRRMAAEAASAQIMDGLFGAVGDKGQRDFSGGLLGAAFSGIAGLFHEGGMVGSGGNAVSVPMGVFSGAPRLHNGGYLKPDEVPAILQTGEMVLSRKQVAGMGSGSGEVQVNTTVNVSGNGNADNMQKLGGLINTRVREVIVAEKRPGGLLA